MENPFELILEKLKSIENLLIQQKGIESVVDQYPSKEILTIQEAGELLKLSTATIYGMTARSIIPHYKVGKRLYFKV